MLPRRRHIIEDEDEEEEEGGSGERLKGRGDVEAGNPDIMIVC